MFNTFHGKVLNFAFCLFVPIKKAGKRGFSLYPPVLTARFGFLYHVLGLLMICFKQSQVHIYLHLAPAVETFWHSPRVPTDAASAELKITYGNE